MSIGRRGALDLWNFDQALIPDKGDVVTGALPAEPVTPREEEKRPMPTLNAPKLVSSRDQARELTAELPADLEGTAVVVNCSALRASTPSFVDELVKVCLVERRAKSLVLVNAPGRTAELARRASRNRNVADRLEIDPPLEIG